MIWFYIIERKGGVILVRLLAIIRHFRDTGSVVRRTTNRWDRQRPPEEPADPRILYQRTGDGLHE